MRIVSFNANGLRSAATKGFFDWFVEQDIDVLCLQETKAQESQLNQTHLQPAGYQRYFKDAITKKGYSGVGIYSRREPDAVIDQIGIPVFDDEGRYIEARYGELSVVSMYLPSGSSGDVRQAFKYQMMEALETVFAQWRSSGREYVICGDWNIVRSRLDIKNWTSNQKNSGCLPEERAWMNRLIEDCGWVDAYRQLHPEGQDYTWWSQRGAARAKNVGWRIDYQIVTPGWAQRLQDCRIAAEPKFSDHAPFIVDYRE